MFSQISRVFKENKIDEKDLDVISHTGCTPPDQVDVKLDFDREATADAFSNVANTVGKYR